MLCGITVTGSGVLLNARNYGVLRLQGYPYTRILARDLAQIGRFHLLAGGCTVVGITAALLLYNGLAQFVLFARIAGWLLALFLGTALLTHAFALALLQATSLLDALKGRIPARPATASAYAVRVPALVLVLVSVSLVVHSAQNLREHREEFDVYSEAGQASRITLSGSVDFAEVGESMDPLVGGWLRQADEEGQIILSVRQQSAVMAPPGEPAPGADLLVVNDTYLEHQEILSPDGERYGPSDTVRVLLPESLAEWEETVARSAGERAASWNGYGRPAGSDPQRFDTEVLPTADGQEVFTYGSDGPVGRPRVPFLDDPVIFVLPDGAVLSDKLYVAFATQAGIVFPDPEEVEESIATPPFSTYINGLQMVVTSLADDYAEQVRHLRLQSFNLAAATGVLVMTAVAVCLVHVRTRAQTIFAKHISGWRFTAIHRRLLVAEGALALAFLGWAALRAFRVLIRVDGPPTPGTLAPTPEQAAVAALEPLLAIAIAGGGLLLIAAILLYFHRRIVREGAAQA
ncbi:hypothetical protein [Nocardiopsis sp. LOL_012]|uniref:hypothetical protein n=1 Tax=Nocardiopsis sp. LOL_012 TaxID=3345409 RepID=UPI003A899DB9